MGTAQVTSRSAIMDFAKVTNNIENIEIQKYLIDTYITLFDAIIYYAVSYTHLTLPTILLV